MLDRLLTGAGRRRAGPARTGEGGADRAVRGAGARPEAAAARQPADAAPARRRRSAGARQCAFARLLLDLYLVGPRPGHSSKARSRSTHGWPKTWSARPGGPRSWSRSAASNWCRSAATHENDGEFVVETSYLVDLGSLEIYVERQITPARLRSAAPKVQHRVRLVVEEAGLYPGLPPRRIRLGRFQRAPLELERRRSRRRRGHGRPVRGPATAGGAGAGAVRRAGGGGAVPAGRAARPAGRTPSC